MKKRLVKKQAGFTLIELMFTLTIAGVLMAIGVPELGAVIKNNRISADINRILGSLQYARGEAITRGVNITMTPIIAGNDWSAGWQIGVDADSNGVLTDVGDTITRSFEGVNQSTLLSIAGVTNIVFNTTGSRPGADTTFTLTANVIDTACHVRVISLRQSGITRIIPIVGC